MKSNTLERFQQLKSNNCWQYEIRVKNLEEDLKLSKLTAKDASKLRVQDFEFSYVDKSDKETCKLIKDFIEKKKS